MAGSGATEVAQIAIVTIFILASLLAGTIHALEGRAKTLRGGGEAMKWNMVIPTLAVACMLPSIASAQQKKVTCADNTIVTSDEACSRHGGVQKPGGLNKLGHEIKGAATDVKDEAKRTPDNVESAAKTTGHNISQAAGDVSHATKKTAKKAKHGASDAAGDVSKTAQKTVHPKTYKANCTDGTTWEGRSKSNACKNHGGVANWS